MVAVLVALILGFLAGRAGAGTDAASPPAPAGAVHVVRPGDTVWAIARRVAGPEADPRPVVDRIIAMNDLSGATIHPGDRLALP